MLKNRVFVMGAVAAAALFAACSSNNAQSIPSAPSFPTNGSTASYSTIEWGNVWVGSSPKPHPVPTTQISARSVVVTTGASFNGQNDLIDFHYTAKALAPKVVAGSDEYVKWHSVAGGQELQEIADVSHGKGTGKSPYEVSSRTIYTQPPISVELPFAAGKHWNGSSAYRSVLSGTTTVYNAPVKIADDLTWNADGTYTQSTLNYPIILIGHSLRSVTTVSSNGSVKQTSSTDGGKPLVYTIGAPRRAAGGKYVIPISLEPHGFKADIPDWYPGGGLPPSPFDSVNVVDHGPAALPALCNVPRSLATSGEAIVRTESRFDPGGAVNSIYDTAYYANGIGLVCDVMAVQAVGYFVLPPVAKRTLRESIHVIESFTAAKLQSALVRTRSLTGALDYAGQALLADVAHERTSILTDLRRRMLERCASAHIVCAIR